ncbi:MAG: ATP-dependent Clp protease ATP-binding subunit [Thermotogae bacterium]|nr:ATP-dependent Clp protease ATP-binding subunit [Thermotogota bacterium]
MNPRDFTIKSIEVIKKAQEIASESGGNVLRPEHVLLAILESEDEELKKIFENVDVEDMKERLEDRIYEDVEIYYGNSSVVYLSTPMNNALKKAKEEARRTGHRKITVPHLLLGIILDGTSFASSLLLTHGVTKDKIYEVLKNVKVSEDGMEQEIKDPIKAYTTDLTELARQKKLMPVIGREEEIKRIMEILSRKTKNNPVLVGDPGVGKTAIVEGLAQMIARGDVPKELKNKRILQLDLARLLAGTKYRGEFEERIKNLVDKLKSMKDNVILFIDELHTIIGAGSAEGGSMDAANILKPELARGELRVIGATTVEEYRKYIEKDKALARRFQPVYIGEPTPEETIDILKGLKESYEKHHNVKIEDEAIESAVKLSHRYIADRFLPDKAIDLIDEAAAKVKLRKEMKNPKLREFEEKIENLEKEIDELVMHSKYKEAAELKEKLFKMREDMKALKDELSNDEDVVDEQVVAEVLESWTGIPAGKILSSEREKLLNLEDEIHKRIVDQDEAVRIVAQHIRRARAGLKDPRRPIGSFLFLGPTGVGKTELAKALAEVLFDGEDSLIRIDMSEYMEKHSVSRLIGAPPGYVGYEEGGQLTEAVRRKPYSVILLDEIEKAHPDVFNILLQVLDDGRLTDGKGNTVDFRNTIIIMTSNLGSERILKLLEGGIGADEIERRIKEDLKGFFRPEFLNRLDAIVVFKPLTMDEVKRIVEIMIRRLEEKLKEKRMKINITEKAKEELAKRGYDPVFGARPLRRVIEKDVEVPLAEKMIAGEIKEGETVIVDLSEDGEFTFTSLREDMMIDTVEKEKKDEKEPA